MLSLVSKQKANSKWLKITLLQHFCAYNSSGDPIKMEILILQAYDWGRNSFPTGSQVVLMLPVVNGPQFQYQGLKPQGNTQINIPGNSEKRPFKNFMNDPQLFSLSLSLLYHPKCQLHPKAGSTFLDTVCLTIITRAIHFLHHVLQKIQSIIPQISSKCKNIPRSLKDFPCTLFSRIRSGVHT